MKAGAMILLLSPDLLHLGEGNGSYVTLFLFPYVFLWRWGPNVASPLQESGGQHRRKAEYPAQSMIRALS